MDEFMYIVHCTLYTVQFHYRFRFMKKFLFLNFSLLTKYSIQCRVKTEEKTWGPQFKSLLA